MMWAPSKQTQQNARHGFTIVELLIVIVVIAILAAITIVAYNGIQNRAKASAAQTAASQAARKVLAWSAQNLDACPATLAIAEVNDTSNLQYTPDPNSVPCKFGITATNNNVSYYVSEQATSPKPGGYPGHGSNGAPAITNIATNPGYELSQNGTSTVNGASSTRQASSAISGSNGLQLSCASGGTVDCGANVAGSVSVVSGKTYTYQVTIRAKSAVSYSAYLAGASGVSSKIYTPTLSVGDTWTFRITKAAASSGNAIFYVLRGSTAATVFDVDSLMVTEGSTDYKFADGNTQNWIWTDTPDASMSTGPALSL